MSTETVEQSQTGLIKVEEITSIMTGAGDVLAKNEKLVTAAAKAGQGYLDTIEGGEMTDELDKELNIWQGKAKDALLIMNNRRAPITQMMTRIARVFTGLENQIDPTKPDSVYTKIQNHRNAYAKQKAEIQKQKEAAILKQQNIEKEKISLKAEIEKQIREKYQNTLYAHKKSANDKFNAMTLDTVAQTTDELKVIKLNYPRDKFLELPVNIVSLYLDKSELAPIIYNTRIELFDELSVNFRENMEDIQQSLLNLIPSREMELKEIAKASKAEQQRLNDEARKRQEEENQRLLDEAAEAKKNDESRINLDKQMAVTGNLFDTTAQLAEVKENAGPVRQGYKITVLSMAGWGAIFLFWFEKEGQHQDAMTIGKKTLEQMKTFCEKYAHKNNEKISNEHVVYEEDYKAIATKA